MKKGIQNFPNLIIFGAFYCAVMAGLVSAQGIYPQNNQAPDVKPVNVTAGMSPTLVPEAQPQSVTVQNKPRVIVNTPPQARKVKLAKPGGALAPYYPPSNSRANTGGDAAGPQDFQVHGAGTGIGGSNDHGNANTGGVQVQNVTVQSNPDQAQTAQLNSDINNEAYNGFHSARDLRIDTENAHNALILQKLENERLKAEWRRRTQIEQFGEEPPQVQQPVYEGGAYPGAAPAEVHIYGASASAAAGPGAEAISGLPVDEVETVEVAAVGDSMASSSIHSSVVSSSASKPSAFSIFPFLGKRWFSGVDSRADVENQYVFGVGAEGRINDMFSLEALFTYGVDDFSGKGVYQGFFYNIQDASRESYEIQASAKVSKQVGIFRPFASFGLGYLYQSYDIDYPGVLDAMNDIGWDRSTANVFTNLGFGADVFVTDAMSVGLRADYQYVIDSDKYEGMNEWWGDNSNRLRAAGNLNIVF